MRILFVCLGNICRSPLAEGVFNHLVYSKRLGKKFTSDSAGTAAYHVGQLPDTRSMKIAKENHFKLNHKARQFCLDDFFDFDLIIAMDRNNLKDIEHLRPANCTTPVKLMSAFSDDATLVDIPDPYYGDYTDFAMVYVMLNNCCTNLLHSLT